MTNFTEKPSSSEIILYQTEDGKTRIEVRMEGETVWLTQQSMAELFQTTKQNISLHIQNIFEEGELSTGSTVKKYLTVQREGQREVKRLLEYYNLDMIISVGYRVKSHVATRFRIWATQRLREYIIKGFTLDDERLKQAGGGNYFDELLSRIRVSVPRRKSFGARCWTFMPPASIMISTPTSAGNFSPWCRTRCTGRRMDTRRRK